jgi:Tol biopolymer transport system component
VNADGSHPHALFPDWADYSSATGAWSPDGNYFFFSASRGVTPDLWVVARRRRPWKREVTAPMPLTAGPIEVDRIEPTPHGHRLFFIGTLERGELVRRDAKSGQWTPYLGGMAAMQLDFSRDGKWLTYVAYPEGSVWRSAIDGSQRMQLTAPPLFARNPRWSPDGSQIAFYGAAPGNPDRIYVVSPQGGAVRAVTHGEGGPGGDDDASWSPDSASLVFGAQFQDELSGQGRRLLEVLDLRTQRISPLPGSEGLWSARWSPDGRYIAALGSPNAALWLYDVAAHARKQLVAADVAWPNWSQDSQYVYFDVAEWCRVRIKDGRVERLGSLTGLRIAPQSMGWVGPAPDGSPMFIRDLGSTDIYALDWQAP